LISRSKIDLAIGTFLTGPLALNSSFTGTSFGSSSPKMSSSLISSSFLTGADFAGSYFLLAAAGASAHLFFAAGHLCIIGSVNLLVKANHEYKWGKDLASGKYLLSSMAFTVTASFWFGDCPPRNWFFLRRSSRLLKNA
jgi:hypothetical protein